MPLTPQQALDYIFSFDDAYMAALRDHGKQTWGLETIGGLLEKLGSPHLAYPTIHIAGTKGKGSTAAFIAQAMIASGLKTGLYVSPHLQDWSERIQVNRKPISGEQLARLVEDARPFTDQFPTLSTFEVVTALALWHFAREGCDAAVIEVGLGGRLDATSVVEPVVSVITSISMDHMMLLGDTLAAIAGEKAAIIKAGTPVVSAPQQPEALRVIEERAREQNSPLTLIGRDWQVNTIRQGWDGLEIEIDGGEGLQRYSVGMGGEFQAENAATALAALHQAKRAGLPVTAEGMRKGLAETRWPGRFEVVSRQPTIILDSAHNPYSVQRLVDSLTALLDSEQLTVIFGCMADKDIDGMLEALIPASRRLVLTSAGHPRAASAEDLARRAQELSDSREGLVIEHAPTVEEAVQHALETLKPGEVLCATGSLTIAGAARTYLSRQETSDSTDRLRDALTNAPA